MHTMLKSHYLFLTAFTTIIADLYFINSLWVFDKSIIISEILYTEFSQPHPPERSDQVYTDELTEGFSKALK